MSPFILSIIVSFVVTAVLGFVWYSPAMFGKTWMRIMGDCVDSSGASKKGKGMLGMYGLQFLVALIYIFAFNFLLALLIPLNLFTTFICTLGIFVGFVLPIVAVNALWSGKPRKAAWKMFAISGGYQFVMSLIIGLVYWLVR